MSNHGEAEPFPVIKDLVVDRSAFDRIIQAGGYISAPTGTAPMRTPTRCPNVMPTVRSTRRPASAVAPASRPAQRLGDAVHRREDHPSRLAAQGQPERYSRVVGMVAQHDAEGFGGCTNIGECTAVCPKEIPLATISRLNRDLISA